MAAAVSQSGEEAKPIHTLVLQKANLVPQLGYLSETAL